MKGVIAVTSPVPVRSGTGGRAHLTAVPAARTPDGTGHPDVMHEPRPVAITVRAADAITGEGAEAYLSGAEAVLLVPWDERQRAEIVLVLDHAVTDATVGRLQDLFEETGGEGPPVLLVVDEISERHLLSAVRFGVVGVLLRREARYSTVLLAARKALSGEAPMPPALVRTVVEELRVLQSSALLRDSDLTPRETAVLRLLAEGLSTLEIADRLSYSERTIKSVLHEVTTRLKLRNRTHAVAYGIRKGVV
ncbi:helix-turn-helix transcriptional regulator [Streptomyces spiralis]|uniref:Helix-turn-helix transcriptional regulator n=1 Tax=Streptomyces spiralis TaxID=66376 RepID=A0A919AHS6_9ACTN|nr:helix-turn-helix transcriptional regulator [Streptomyces spiralis]